MAVAKICSLFSELLASAHGTFNIYECVSMKMERNNSNRTIETLYECVSMKMESKTYILKFFFSFPAGTLEQSSSIFVCPC